MRGLPENGSTKFTNKRLVKKYLLIFRCAAPF